MMPRRSFGLISFKDVISVIVGTTISNGLLTRSNPFSHATNEEVTTTAFELIDVPSVTDIEMTKLTKQYACLQTIKNPKLSLRNSNVTILIITI